MSAFVYIVECRDGTFYTGWTNDIEKRINAHNSGCGAKYTRSRTPVTLVYKEEFKTKNEALAREAAIKRMSREEKTALTEEYGLHDARNSLDKSIVTD